jgi:hypothetical protein
MLTAAVPGLAPGRTRETAHTPAITTGTPEALTQNAEKNTAEPMDTIKYDHQYHVNPLFEDDMPIDVSISDTEEVTTHTCTMDCSPRTKAPTTIHPHRPSPNTLWVPPEAVGLYCQVQDRGNCALHALNAMAGRIIITPDEALAILRHPQVPRPDPNEPLDCNDDGWFKWEAINRLLYYTTTTDLALVVLESPIDRTQHTLHRQSAKSRILALAPPDCNALYIHTPGHYICWKQSPVNGRWYCLDSIPYAATGQIRELRDNDWADIDGTISTTLAIDAYLHNTTGLALYKHRRVHTPACKSHLRYVDLADITLATLTPAQRPAAAWIAEDTKRAQARSQAKA